LTWCAPHCSATVTAPATSDPVPRSESASLHELKDAPETSESSDTAVYHTIAVAAWATVVRIGMATVLKVLITTLVQAVCDTRAEPRQAESAKSATAITQPMTPFPLPVFVNRLVLRIQPSSSNWHLGHGRWLVRPVAGWSWGMGTTARQRNVLHGWDLLHLLWWASGHRESREEA
jgi:hypothetical protein